MTLTLINTYTILISLFLLLSFYNVYCQQCSCLLPSCCCQLVQYNDYIWSGNHTLGENTYETVQAECLNNSNCLGIHQSSNFLYQAIYSGTFTIHSGFKAWKKECINQTCEENGLITHFNWNELMENKHNNTIPYSNYSLTVNPNTLQLSIKIDLQYLGYSIGEKQSHIGTTYVLDFQAFEGDNNGKGINMPGNCQNRKKSDFNDKTWMEYWQYSDTPYINGHIANKKYLAYPPNTKYWQLSSNNKDKQCNRIHYQATFGWTDLINCKTANDSRHLLHIHTDSKWINLTGIFYTSIVSPLSDIGDIGFYRVYQLISSPFAIAISKSSSIISSTGIDLFVMSLVAVYKEDNIKNPTEDDFKLIVLTESADYLYLSSPKLMSTPNILSAQFIINDDAYNNGNQQCIVSTHSAICTQLWEIYALNVQCPPNSFSGTYIIEWNATCDNVVENEFETNVCQEYVNKYGNDVLLSADLIWTDDICDEEIWVIQFEGNMNFYKDTTFDVLQGDYLYVIGEDRVYVEVVINYPASTYSVFQSSLTNVWVCSVDPDIDRNKNEELVFISQDLSNLGCLNEEITDQDGPYWIIQNYNQQFLHQAVHHTVSDGSSNKVRFSFIVPDTIIRDTIYVHAQITLSLVADNNNQQQTRRILLNIGTITDNKHHKPNILSNPDPKQFANNEQNVENMDQIRHFGGTSGVMQKIFGDEELQKKWNKNFLIVSCSVFFSLMFMGIVGFKIHKSDPINWQGISDLIEMRRLRRLERLRMIGGDKGRVWYGPVRHYDSQVNDDRSDDDLLMSHDDGCNDHF